MGLSFLIVSVLFLTVKEMIIWVSYNKEKLKGKDERKEESKLLLIIIDTALSLKKKNASATRQYFYK